MEEQQSVRVCLRIRPLNPAEVETNNAIPWEFSKTQIRSLPGQVLENEARRGTRISILNGHLTSEPSFLYFYINYINYINILVWIRGTRVTLKYRNVLTYFNILKLK